MFKSIIAALFLSLAITSPAWPSSPPSVDVNTATAEELAEALHGVGMAKARAIVEYRDENGSFEHIDELVNVRGIGLRTVDRNRDRIELPESTGGTVSTPRRDRTSLPGVGWGGFWFQSRKGGRGKREQAACHCPAFQRFRIQIGPSLSGACNPIVFRRPGIRNDIPKPEDPEPCSLSPILPFYRIGRRELKAWARVERSVCSSSPPSGTPWARREVRMPRRSAISRR
jgi:competence protein ComEA